MTLPDFHTLCLFLISVFLYIIFSLWTREIDLQKHTITMDDLQTSTLIANDEIIKKNSINKMYFLVGLHFTVVSTAAFCLFMTPGVRPFVQQHAYLVPLFILIFMGVLAINKYVNNSFGWSILMLVLLTGSVSLAVSAVSLYLDTENGYLIFGIVAISWFFHWALGSFSCIRISLEATLIITPFFLVIGSLILIEAIGLFSFDIFLIAPTTFLMMLYILAILHRNIDDYTEDTLISFRRIYPNIFCIRKM